MYNQNYDDYIQNILGYRSANSMENYNMPTMNTYNTEEYMKFQGEQSNVNLEKLYPETYRLVNPMVMKICEENTKPITQETLEQMTKTVRANFDGDGNVEINVKTDLKNGDVVNPRLKDTARETRTLNYLDDLITILIIKNLLTRPRPPYPPMPGPGPRPPYPPMPGPGPRPPYPPMPGPGPRPPYPPMPGSGPRPPYPPMPGPGSRPPYMRGEEYNNINIPDNNYNEM